MKTNIFKILNLEVQIVNFILRQMENVWLYNFFLSLIFIYKNTFVLPLKFKDIGITCRMKLILMRNPAMI